MTFEEYWQKEFSSCRPRIKFQMKQVWSAALEAGAKQLEDMVFSGEASISEVSVGVQTLREMK